jgi:indolepyruvate ferredoxin oxidoreductase
MTGGQHVGSELSPQRSPHPMHSEGIREIYLVSENPHYPASITSLGIKVAHRDDLDAVRKACREIKSTSAIVFVQTCAAEKRRRLAWPDGRPGAPRDQSGGMRGCGDCSFQCCISVSRWRRSWGRKRTINQSTCNKDYSCPRVRPSLSPSMAAGCVTGAGGPRRHRRSAGAGLAAVAGSAL